MKTQQIQKDKGISYAIAVPESVSCDIHAGHALKLKGAKGETERRFFYPGLTLKKEGSTLILAAASSKRKSKRIINSYHAHIANLIQGVQQGFMYKLKICSGHFPITVKQEGDKITISNFLGEKIPRVAKILPGATVKIEKEIITVEAPNIETAGQTAANMEAATTIRGRDRRVFQDGIYIIEKPGKVI